MKLWIDDVRPAPEGYYWCRSVNQAKRVILVCESDDENEHNHLNLRDNNIDKKSTYQIELLDVDHDAGYYAQFGGDFIKLLDWLEATGRNYPIRIHSANPVGVQNMRRIIERNGWKELK